MALFPCFYPVKIPAIGSGLQVPGALFALQITGLSSRGAAAPAWVRQPLVPAPSCAGDPIPRLDPVLGLCSGGFTTPSPGCSGDGQGRVQPASAKVGGGRQNHELLGPIRTPKLAKVRWDRGGPTGAGLWLRAPSWRWPSGSLGGGQEHWPQGEAGTARQGTRGCWGGAGGAGRGPRAGAGSATALSPSRKGPRARALGQDSCGGPGPP